MPDQITAAFAAKMERWHILADHQLSGLMPDSERRELAELDAWKREQPGLYLTTRLWGIIREQADEVDRLRAEAVSYRRIQTVLACELRDIGCLPCECDDGKPAEICRAECTHGWAVYALREAGPSLAHWLDDVKTTLPEDYGKEKRDER